MSLNQIGSRVEASLESSSVTAPAGRVGLDATDASRIYSVAHGGSLALSGSPSASGSLSLAVVTARNEIGTQVVAEVADSDVTAVDVAVEAAALPESNISSRAIATGAAGSVSVFSGAITGAGAAAENEIDGGVRALVSGASDITTTGPLTVSAKDAASIDSATGAGGLAFGTIAVSIGASTNRNELDRVVSASLDGGDQRRPQSGRVRQAEALSVVTRWPWGSAGPGPGAGRHDRRRVGRAAVRPTADVHANV